MGYNFSQTDATVADAVRRIAVERIDSAIAALDGAARDGDATTHLVRKRCKQMRALVRLVAPVLPRAKREDRAFRDIGRALSGDRDATVMATTFDALVKGAERPLDVDTTYAVRMALVPPAADDKAAAARTEALDMLRDARARADGWVLKADRWAAIGDGLAETYASARTRMKAAAKTGDADAMHEWRKYAKAHLYQIELIRPVWSAGLKPHAKAADRLGEALGEHHDLAVLSERIGSTPGDFGGERAIMPLMDVSRRRQDALETETHRLGVRLFAEEPDAFAARLRRYWKEWQRDVKASSSALAAAA